jgi:hypothetical protein
MELTITWLFWRHVTADPDYTTALDQIAVSIEPKYEVLT